MPRNPLTTVAIVLVLLLGLLVAMFAIQNGPRTTQLSIDLGLFAWKLEQPISVPVLMAICFGTGFLVPAVWGLISTSRARSRVKRLEGELAMISGRGDDGWSR